MSEILLQTIVEKLEAIEIASLKESNAGKDALQQTLLKEVRLVQSEIKKLASQFEVRSERMGELLQGMRNLSFKLDIPLNEKIKHSHHLHKGIWISVGLFIISFLLLYGWIDCNNEKKAFEEKDIKYRFLKVNNNPSLIKLLFQIDSLHNMNKDSFAKLVIVKEQILVEQAEQFRLAGEKKKDAGRVKKSGKSLSEKMVIY